MGTTGILGVGSPDARPGLHRDVRSVVYAQPARDRMGHADALAIATIVLVEEFSAHLGLWHHHAVARSPHRAFPVQSLR